MAMLHVIHLRCGGGGNAVEDSHIYSQSPTELYCHWDHIKFKLGMQIIREPISILNGET